MSEPIGWHEFVPGTICNVKMCARCDEPYHVHQKPTEIVQLRKQLAAFKRQLKRIIKKIDNPEWHRRRLRKNAH